MEIVSKKDFIELEFTGKANGDIFDTNILSDLIKINPEAKPKKTIVCIGEGMVVSGLDNQLEGKEIGKEYSITIPYKEGFGERKKDLVKTIPLRVFTEQKVMPHPGETLFLDNMVVKVITISGARVITDFNNPLAGKDLEYTFIIKRKVNDEKEKVESLFDFFFRTIPDFDINNDKIIVKGHKMLQYLVNNFSETFKELVGKNLEFMEEIKTSKNEQTTSE